VCGGQPAGIQRQDDLVDLSESSLSLADDDRFEGALPVTVHLQLDLTSGVGQHRLGPRAVADIGRIPGTGCPVLLMPGAGVVPDWARRVAQAVHQVGAGDVADRGDG